MPLMRRLDPETAHDLALRGLRAGFGGFDRTPDDPILAVQAFGRTLRNPIGLAAGFDKNAVAVNALGRLGFGFVEAGTVTPRPQAGNPRPRLFRLPEDKAVINRMGFNNGGIDAYLANLRGIDRGLVALGANVGINKEGADPERDYPALVSAVSPFADYVTVNISSPNTPGLRDLQGEARLSGILSAIVTDKPIFVKIAPDLAPEGLEAVIGVCLARKVSGLIVSNTTIARPDTLRGAARTEAGGLSGAPLLAPSTAMLAQAYRLAGKKLMLIGVGGIFTAEDALAKILAGASLVQVYTGFAYQGPPMIPKLKTGLAQLLRARGFPHIQDAVGAGA
ncbi:MAG TPA: quinone-dependent dihydroorotate dehydrogenase [Acidocella sp.]|uniref:quinone-dependent dihydroorotate dehydrogenase n=1 Tax=Acidocella sp. TaxID=50710 RepID=UPI002BD34B83|nr:quinone-dependent dihydroorotate dehydrogenase [Acidocella sp.]HVE22550.1 quinone-dependent dihydroorotate dehydrogenase [Acidocella sp.]